MYVVYINLLYFLSIFLFTYNKNLLSPKKICIIIIIMTMTMTNVLLNINTYSDSVKYSL